MQDWLLNQYKALAGIQTRLHAFQETGCLNRPTRDNVVAWIPGKHPERIVLLGGHYDSRTVNVSDGVSPAPGANDSGSQTSVVLELARAFAGHTFDATLAFVAFAGEEQGLVGSKALASNVSIGRCGCSPRRVGARIARRKSSRPTPSAETIPSPVMARGCPRPRVLALTPAPPGCYDYPACDRGCSSRTKSS